MGRIYVRINPGNGNEMAIPQNVNIATAMYGFRELGAEIIPYKTVTDIYDQIEKEDIILDGITQCKTVFGKFDKDPKLPNYPEALSEFLGREVWEDTIEGLVTERNRLKSGLFVKPVERKLFTGQVVKDLDDLYRCWRTEGDLKVYVSDKLNIKAEWRCFILDDKLIDVRPYGSINEKTYRGYFQHFDALQLERMLNKFVKWDERPAACGLDICLTKENKTLFLELNDAYALGCYGLPSLLYAKMISARWSQILGVKNEYEL